jgi:hypothetical protein
VRTCNVHADAFSVSQRGFSLDWNLQGKVARTPHQRKGSGGTVCRARPHTTHRATDSRAPRWAGTATVTTGRQPARRTVLALAPATRTPRRGGARPAGGASSHTPLRASARTAHWPRQRPHPYCGQSPHTPTGGEQPPQPTGRVSGHSDAARKDDNRLTSRALSAQQAPLWLWGPCGA